MTTQFNNDHMTPADHTVAWFKKKKIRLVIPALILLVAGSPVYEFSTDAIVGDAVITKTCWDRHGFNFITRWSCRSTFHNAGFIALSLGCAFDKNKTDICENFTKMSKEADEAASKPGN